ncbi:MAG: hypothetical protein JOY77_01825 [Alphaproteobacteria bacterium]|nr:hypothetical protein [Alphaproteobacteria bacterium]
MKDRQFEGRSAARMPKLRDSTARRRHGVGNPDEMRDPCGRKPRIARGVRPFPATLQHSQLRP